MNFEFPGASNIIVGQTKRIAQLTVNLTNDLAPAQKGEAIVNITGFATLVFSAHPASPTRPIDGADGVKFELSVRDAVQGAPTSKLYEFDCVPHNLKLNVPFNASFAHGAVAKTFALDVTRFRSDAKNPNSEWYAVIEHCKVMLSVT